MGVNPVATALGITVGMASADAKAMVPEILVIDDFLGLYFKLLKVLGEWCIRYSPLIAVDLPDGLLMDISGCAHLWGSERDYLKEIVTRLRSKGYDVRGSNAFTAGASLAIARFGRVKPIIEQGEHTASLLT